MATEIEVLPSENLLRTFAEACAERGTHTVAFGIPLYSAEEFNTMKAEILRRMKAGNGGK